MLEHKTLVRICMFEVKKTADEMTENDWKNYFLAANVGNEVDIAVVEGAMKSLHMDIDIKDAESRVMKLLTDFQNKLEVIDMEAMMYEEPKQCVQFLCRALAPQR